MKKNFYSWHLKKSEIHESPRRPFFDEREVWFCYLGVNVGFEQDGEGANFLRPVLILKKFNPYVFWCVPLTRTIKNNPFYFEFYFDGKAPSVAIISQIKLLDSRRLKHKLGLMPLNDFNDLKIKIRQLLA